MSIMFLFLAVTAVAAGGVMVVMELRSKLESSRPMSEFQTSDLTGGAPSPVYKMQNFAYLEPTSSLLENTTMRWAVVHYGPGTSVGSNFVFDPAQHSLQPQRVGTYFMYIDLNITCTHKCSTSHVSVSVGDKLTCEVELPANSTSVSRKCWTVSRVDGVERLSAQMTVPKEGLKNWKLELSHSGFGMFLVD